MFCVSNSEYGCQSLWNIGKCSGFSVPDKLFIMDISVAVSSSYCEIEMHALKSSWVISHAKMELFQTSSLSLSSGC